jgi:hypothetical protein
MDKYVDAWDVHGYPQHPLKLEGTFTNSPNEGEVALRTIYKRLGKTDFKPLWIGETGAWAFHGKDGRRWQADTCAKMAACALSRNDIEVIAFLLPWGYEREKAGLWGLEAGHMPAEAAYYTASALIDGFDYHRLDLGSGIEAARFGPTVMLWSEYGEKSATLPVDQDTPMVLVDVVGRVENLPVGTNGKVQMTVGSSPVYILSSKDYEDLTW